MPANTAAPETGPRSGLRKSVEGFGTSAKPAPVISNTPISSVGPKRFLTARTMRN